MSEEVGLLLMGWGYGLTLGIAVQSAVVVGWWRRYFRDRALAHMSLEAGDDHGMRFGVVEGMHHELLWAYEVGVGFTLEVE